MVDRRRVSRLLPCRLRRPRGSGRAPDSERPTGGPDPPGQAPEWRRVRGRALGRSSPAPLDIGGAVVCCSVMFIPRIGVTVGLADEVRGASDAHIYLAHRVIASATRQFLTAYTSSHDRWPVRHWNRGSLVPRGELRGRSIPNCDYSPGLLDRVVVVTELYGTETPSFAGTAGS